VKVLRIALEGEALADAVGGADALEFECVRDVGGAVASASAAAAAPLLPRWVSARWVDLEIVLPTSALELVPPALELVPPALELVPLPLELPPLELEPPPDRGPPPAATWTVLEGRAPLAVGTSSTYWFTPELPGGATVWGGPFAEAAVGRASASAAKAEMTAADFTTTRQMYARAGRNLTAVHWSFMPEGGRGRKDDASVRRTRMPAYER